MGAFDDLIPAASPPPASGTGAFDDLIPATGAAPAATAPDPGAFGDLVPGQTQSLTQAPAVPVPPGAALASGLGDAVSNAWDATKQAFGDEPVGIDPTSENSLRAAGVIPDPATGQGGPLRTLNEAIIRPVWAAGDAAARGLSAGFAGAQALTQGALDAYGVNPQLSRDVAGAPEAFMGSPELMERVHGEEPPEAPAPTPAPAAPVPEAASPEGAFADLIPNAGEPANLPAEGNTPAAPVPAPASEPTPTPAPTAPLPETTGDAAPQVEPPVAPAPEPPAQEPAPSEPQAAPPPVPPDTSVSPVPPSEPLSPPPAEEGPAAPAPAGSAEPATQVAEPATTVPTDQDQVSAPSPQPPVEGAEPTTADTGTTPVEGAPPPETNAPVEQAPAPVPASEPTPALADQPLADQPMDAQPANAGTGTTRAPLGGVRPERDFNTETSPYRQVFRDAGYDPDTATSLPIKRQAQIVSDHVRDTFGFKDVKIDPSQNPKEVRDQLSNFYQNGREMASALGMPESAIGLDGKLTFTTKPYRQRNQALGTYYPKDRAIEIPGRSNSFAHEWTHALDHELADQLANNPKAMRLLSMTKGIGEDPAKVGGRLVRPNTPADAFVGVLRSLYGKDAGNAAEALRLQYDLRGSDKAKSLAAQGRLEQIESDFAKGGREAKGGVQYWGTPHEMLARAHEAYVSEMIQRQGGDTRAVAKPYYDARDGADSLAKYYPQQGERDHIFQAFTELHDQLRAKSILGTGTALRPDGLDIVDPTVWDRMADPTQNKGLWSAMRAEVQAQKNFRQTMWDRMGFNEKAADPGSRLGVGTRIADTGRAATYSIRGIGNAITKRQPAGAARDAFQAIMDRMSPAEHIRDASKADSRYVGPVFEEDVREHARPNINRMGNILDQNGLSSMTDQHALMLRHILTEGDANSFVPDGASRPVAIPANITKAASGLRYLLDQEWERNTKAGIDTGYARSGYFPRMYDDHKIFGDRTGFETAAEKLHGTMFDQDVGDDPVKLLAAHDRLAQDTRDNLDPDVQDNVDALRKNLKAQDKLDPEDPANAGQLATLRGEAADLHDQIAPDVRDAYARDAASNWWSRINTGDPTDFDTRGPNASYTSKRVLPPEADQIMRNYMVNDPRTALPMYFQQSARKVAFAHAFGKGGADLDALLKRASDGGARGEDIQSMRGLVESVTGKQKSGLPPPVERAANVVHALGSIALMPRAAWSSLSEPMATLARTGQIKPMFHAFAGQIGDIVKTAGSKQRADIANALGITTSHLYDSIIADRTEAKYRDAPGLSKLMANYYKRTGLTQLTNSQRRSVMAAGHTALGAWGKDILDPAASPRVKRDAAAQFRDLGVPDAQHQNLAKWINERDGLPSLQDLQTPGGKLWGTAVSRLTDKIIQDPMRVDKPLLSQNPLGRLAYGLMSFNYAFYHNVIEHALDTHVARIGEGYSDVRAAGGGKLAALAGTAAPVARAVGHIGASAAAIYAGSLASTAVREAIFNQATWQKQSDQGNLGGWLSDLAVQRTGVNGPLDPVVQALSGLKYERDLSALMSGAQVGYFLQSAGDMLKPFAGVSSVDTNTSRYNAIKGAWNMFGVPAAGVALTSLPGGPLVGAGAGAAMQYVTGRGFADRLATAAVGPKGSDAQGNPPPPPSPPDPDAPAKGSDSGLLGGVPLGVADDFISPGMKLTTSILDRLPKVGKVIAGVGAGAAAVGTLAHALANHPNDGEP